MTLSLPKLIVRIKLSKLCEKSCRLTILRTGAMPVLLIMVFPAWSQGLAGIWLAPYRPMLNE